MNPVFLHFAGASTASVMVVVIAIFFLIFSLSFAFGRLPEGGKRYSGEWFLAWARASLPRMLAAAIFSAGLFTASALSGSSANSERDTSNSDYFLSGACDRTLPPLTNEPLTSHRLQSAISDFREMVSTANSGDGDLLRTQFFTDAHDVTHDIDAPLRAVDPDLAKELCESVLVMEIQMVREIDFEIMAREANLTAGLLAQAAEVMGLSE